MSFIPGVEEPGEPRAGDIVLPFRGARLLVRSGEDPLLRAEELPRIEVVRRHFLGILGGDVGQGERWIYALELGEEDAPEGLALEGLRQLWNRLDETFFALAGRAVQIVAWGRDHRFCGRCGALTEEDPAERARRCHSCGLTVHPRLAPAVIVLVRRGDEILLARSPHFPPGMYSALAGFVEPGETLEETVAREVEEEVGVAVSRVRYFGSQPWPFPNSLMIGFLADHAGGELRIDGHEIEDAGWFTRDSLPAIPPRISIARALIDSFLES